MILITGAAGYVGSMIVHTLHRTFDQPKMIGVDNLSTGYTCNLPRSFECYMGDVGHIEFMSNLIKHHGVQYIIHCAASIVVPESVEKPLAYYANNAFATYELIRAAVANKVKGIIYSSTAAVYGNPEFPRPSKEDDPCRPCSPYGRSKLIGEQMLRDTYVAHGLNSVVLRYFNVAGADPLMMTGQTSPRATHLIKRATQAALGLGPPLQVYGDGGDVRDYVHVADLAAAHLGALDMLTSNENGCHVLNVGSGTGYSVLDVLGALDKVAGKHVPFTTAPRREGDPTYVVADTKLIHTRIGWKPQYDLPQIMEHALTWEKTL